MTACFSSGSPSALNQWCYQCCGIWPACIMCANSGTSMETAPISQTFPSWQSGLVNNASLCSLFSPAINLFLTSSALSGGNGKSGSGPGHTLDFSSAAWAQWTSLTLLRESRTHGHLRQALSSLFWLGMCWVRGRMLTVWEVAEW